ncbi:hypothetical protein GF413_01540 [Candidatus Micrarchaeota archaeon]|nr:hypothetical protein [Candidatus Micrarchaeota archaeon]
MLKKILMEIDAGCGSVRELSDRLGIDGETLSLQLRSLVQQGYLSEHKTHSCRGCPFTASCPGSSNSCTAGTSFSLNKKSRELLAD